MKKRPRELYYEGVKLAEIGDFKARMYKMRQAINADPKLEVAYMFYGTLLVEDGRKADAVTLYRLGVKTLPNSIDLNCMLGLALNLVGSHEEADQQFQFVLSRDPDNAEALIGIGESYTNQERLDEAKLALEKSVRLKDTSTGHFALATVLGMQGDINSALSEVEMCLKLDPEDHAAHALRGGILQEQGNLFGAIESYQESFRLDPTNPETMVSLAEIYSDVGIHQEAVQFYEIALYYEVATDEMINNYAMSLVEVGRPEQARRYLEQLVLRKPENVLYRRILALACVKSKAYDQALDVYLECIESHPENADLHTDLGMFYQLIGQRDRAMREFQRALDLDPTDETAEEGLSELEENH